jgi:sec-independent protein translocase protein TatA
VLDRGRPDPEGYSGPVNLGAPELLIVLLVVLVLFGGAKLPKLARSMGQAQSEFKEGLKEGSKPGRADDEADDKA